MRIHVHRLHKRGELVRTMHKRGEIPAVRWMDEENSVGCFHGRGRTFSVARRCKRGHSRFHDTVPVFFHRNEDECETQLMDPIAKDDTHMFVGWE